MKQKGLHTRRWVACMLLFFMLLPAGFAVLFHAQKMLIRHQMEEALEREQLQSFVLPAHQVIWVKPGKEIRLGHRFFDIKEHRLEGSWLWVKGLYDEEEKKLHQTLDNLMEKSDSQQVGWMSLLIFSFPWKAAPGVASPPLADRDDPGYPASVALPVVYLPMVTPPPLTG